MTSTDSAAPPVGRARRPALLAASTLVVQPRPWLMLAAPPAEETFRQETLPLTYSLPNGLDATPRGGTPTRLRPDDRTSATAAGRRAGADVAEAAAPPDTSPNLWASRFLQAVVEVVCSDRPL